MAIHDRLFELRGKTDLTQKGFADFLGVEQSRYNKWENGKNAPDYEALCRLADKLEVTTDYLLGRTDATKAEQVDIVEHTGLSAGAVEKLNWMKNNWKHGACMLRAINFIIEYSHGVPFLMNLYHYLFSTFSFGNPHQSPGEMENDKRYTTAANIVAYSDELEAHRVDLTFRDMNAIYLSKVHGDILKLKKKAKDVSEDKVVALMNRTEG